MKFNSIINESPTAGRLGFLIGQMKDVRSLLLNQIIDLKQDELDFSPDINKIETIGTLIFHIADVENSWMFEAVDRESLDSEQWKYAFPLRQNLNPRQQTGKPLEYYINILNETRNNVLTRLQKFKDSDLNLEYTNKFGHFTLEWVLYHNQQHESHHIGQINLLKRLKRINFP